MGRATEELAARSGPGIGGLLNVTFGNAPELIIALFALGQGLARGRQGLAGRLDPRQHPAGPGRRDARRRPRARPPRQTFEPDRRERPDDDAAAGGRRADHAGGLRAGRGRRAARSRAPSGPLRLDLEHLSVARRRRLDHHLRRRPGLLAADPPRPLQPRDEDESHTEGWSVRTSALVLAWPSPGSLVGRDVRDPRRLDRARPRTSIGLSEFFIGAIVVAIVGNAAEHWVAVLVACKDKMDLAVNIAIGSSAQIALFVAPVLVLVSFFIGPAPDAARLQRLRAGGPGDRGDHRQPGDPGGRVDLVRGRAAARSSTSVLALTFGFA